HSLLLLPRRPPCLFPYTTLFRSPTEEEAKPLVPVTPTLMPVGVELPFALRVVLPLLVDRDVIVAPLLDLVVGRVFPYMRVRHALDRKSTRLNSSHQIISYAVFCL